MIKRTLFKLASIVSILFAFSTIPAFAQRGGGSHGGGGGGFHGGGGGSSHSGGGGSFRGGASSAPRMDAGFSRPAPSGPMRPSAGPYVRPGGGANRNFNGAVNGDPRGTSSSSVSRGVPGQWRSFGGSSAARGTAPSAPAAGTSGNSAGEWHVFGGSRTAGSTRSFSGEGNQIWENKPLARNVVPASRTLSNIRGSFGNSLAGNSGLRSNSSLLGSSGFARGNMLGNRVFSNGFVSLNHGRGFGNGFNRFGLGFREGCWNCGFGFGFGWGPGWGFGWPWLGLWNSWDPFYWDSLSWGWPGYGYYGYPAGYPYSFYPYDNGYSYSAPNDSYSNMDSSSVSAAPANGAVPVLLFLKDNSVYSVRDFWLSEGQLHYVLLNGQEGAFDVDLLDVQRTVNENAKSGVEFKLKPNPDLSTPPPSQMPPAKSPDSAPRVNLSLPPQIHS